MVNEEKYLDDKYLIEGTDHSLRGKIARQFAMFSEHFSGGKLTDLDVQRLFQTEVLSLCHSGSYMGIWQLAALSNILQTDVVSVYPRYGGQMVRSDLNRTVIPFEIPEVNKKLYIMCSNVQGNCLPEKEWHPNHFVTLIKIYPVENETSTAIAANAEELSPIAEFEESDDDSFNTSLINSIINEMNVEVRLRDFACRPETCD